MLMRLWFLWCTGRTFRHQSGVSTDVVSRTMTRVSKCVTFKFKVTLTIRNHPATDPSIFSFRQKVIRAEVPRRLIYYQLFQY